MHNSRCIFSVPDKCNICSSVSSLRLLDAYHTLKISDSAAHRVHGFKQSYFKLRITLPFIIRPCLKGYIIAESMHHKYCIGMYEWRHLSLYLSAVSAAFARSCEISSIFPEDVLNFKAFLSMKIGSLARPTCPFALKSSILTPVPSSW